MAEFLHMGGHGAYVWSAYGISAIALAGISVWPLIRIRKTSARLRRRLAEERRAGRTDR